MDFEQIFAGGSLTSIEDPASQTLVWTNLQQSYPFLNYVRRWLCANLYTMAVDRVIIRENRTTQYTEQIAQRVYAIPVLADPEWFEDFSVSGQCNEHNSLLFELSANNISVTLVDVTTKDLVWIPQGNQAERFKDQPPRPKMDDLLLFRLHPGQRLSVQMYFVKGQGIQDVKWRQVGAYYRQIMPKLPVDSRTDPTTSSATSSAIQKWSNQGTTRYEFTLDIHGGITFDQIQTQLRLRFECPPELQYYQTPTYLKPIVVQVRPDLSIGSTPVSDLIKGSHKHADRRPSSSNEPIIIPSIEGY